MTVRKSADQKIGRPTPQGRQALRSCSSTTRPVCVIGEWTVPAAAFAPPIAPTKWSMVAFSRLCHVDNTPGREHLLHDFPPERSATIRRGFVTARTDRTSFGAKQPSNCAILRHLETTLLHFRATRSLQESFQWNTACSRCPRILPSAACTTGIAGILRDAALGRRTRLLPKAWIGEHHTAPWEPHPAPDLADRPGADGDQPDPPRAPGAFLLPCTTTWPNWPIG